LIHYYTDQNKFYSIDGIGSVDDIFVRLCGEIDAIA
jgi:adenylate kinase family enzyme